MSIFTIAIACLSFVLYVLLGSVIFGIAEKLFEDVMDMDMINSRKGIILFWPFFILAFLLLYVLSLIVEFIYTPFIDYWVKIGKKIYDFLKKRGKGRRA